MTGISYKDVIPPPPLGNFVDCFWMLHNEGTADREITLLPDGRIDASFIPGRGDYFILLGVDSQPVRTIIPAGMCMYCVSFRMLAPEYLFRKKFPVLVDCYYELPPQFLNLETVSFASFEEFCNVMSETLLSLLPAETDSRRQRLSDIIYASAGSVRVGTLAREVYWSARQINRYLHEWIGISLKSYCDILRFRASFPHIKQGKLYPDPDFADQSHFIKHVRKLSGVTPRELYLNKNDRFIQFSTLPEQ